jgi:hypothetical protein
MQHLKVFHKTPFAHQGVQFLRDYVRARRGRSLIDAAENFVQDIGARLGAIMPAKNRATARK